MKKFILIFISIIIPFFVVGQDVDIVDSIDETDSVDIIEGNSSGNDSDTSNQTTAGLESIVFGFCNEGTDNLSKNLSYAINVGQPIKICSLFQNTSNQDITIRVELVDGGFSADGGKSCNFASTNIQNFIDKDSLTELQEFIVPAGQNVIKEFEITFPIGLEGDQSACYTYYVPKKSAGAMISTTISRGSFMDFFVGSLDDIKNEISISNFKTYLDDNKDLNLNFTLSNIGNLEDEIVIQGEITNIFGFKKEFNIEGKGIQLTPGRSTPVSAVLGSVPAYGGLFNIKFTVTATPFFSYDISRSNIDPSLLEDKVFTVSTTYFQMPWMMLIVVVMFILILYLLFRKPKNK